MIALPTTKQWDKRLFRRLVTLAAATGFFWVLVLPACLLGRRYAGALRSPLSDLGLAATTLSSIMLAVAVAQSLDAIGWASRRTSRLAGALLLVGGLVMLAAAVSLPRTSPLGLALMWGTVFAVAVWLITQSLRPALTTNRHQENCVPVSKELLPNRVDQQLARGRDESGQVFFQGTVRVEIPEGHRSATLHVAICPPLVAAPDVQAEQTDGPPATIRIGAALPQGIRLDVRCEYPVEADQAVMIDFYALEPLSNSQHQR